MHSRLLLRIRDLLNCDFLLSVLLSRSVDLNCPDTVWTRLVGKWWMLVFGWMRNRFVHSDAQVRCRYAERIWPHWLSS